MTPQPQLLEYELGERVKAFSTLREGGFGKEAYATFNVNPFYGDDEVIINKNKDLLCGKLRIGKSFLIIPRQTHGTNICCIDKPFMRLDESKRESMLDGVDALITDLSGVCISVSTADCVPVLVYDEAHHAVAAVHAGWRGTVRRIVETVLNKMRYTYGTNPSDVRAAIGPSISLEAFEVGDEVFQTFSDVGFPMGKIAKKYPVMGVDEQVSEKWHIDLWEANRLELLRAGVSNDNIEVAGVCTYKNHERFFSARRLGLKSGRILNGIMYL